MLKTSATISLAAFALGVAARASNSSSTTTTPTPTEPQAQVNVFEAHQTGHVPLWPGWANQTTTPFWSHFSTASVVNAAACESTFAVVFTPSGVAPLTYTVTDGPSAYAKTYSFSSAGFEATATQTCRKSGRSDATCTENWSASDTAGLKTSETQTVTWTFNNYTVDVFEVPRKWINILNNTCTTTKEGSAAKPTGLVARDVVKVIVVPAAAMIAGVLL